MLRIKYSLRSIVAARNTDTASPPLRDETVCTRQCILCDPEMTPGSHVMGASMNGTPQRKWLCNTQVTQAPHPSTTALLHTHKYVQCPRSIGGNTLFYQRNSWGFFRTTSQANEISEDSGDRVAIVKVAQCGAFIQPHARNGKSCLSDQRRGLQGHSGLTPSLLPPLFPSFPPIFPPSPKRPDGGFIPLATGVKKNH